MELWKKRIKNRPDRRETRRNFDQKFGKPIRPETAGKSTSCKPQVGSYVMLLFAASIQTDCLIPKGMLPSYMSCFDCLHMIDTRLSKMPIQADDVELTVRTMKLDTRPVPAPDLTPE